MMGREAYTNPYLLSDVDRLIYGSKTPIKTREDIAEQFLQYVDNEMSKGVRLHAMTRHILGLFHGDAPEHDNLGGILVRMPINLLQLLMF